jgi:hypothetical protein
MVINGFKNLTKNYNLLTSSKIFEFFGAKFVETPQKKWPSFLVHDKIHFLFQEAMAECSRSVCAKNILYLFKINTNLFESFWGHFNPQI